MKRTFIFVCICLLAGSMSDAQQNAPAPSPIAPQAPPPPPAGPSRPTAPAQAVVPVPVPIAPPKPNGPVQKSLVRITATSVEPDYKAPWNSGGIQRGVGAGFVIGGNRILTNAHVVSNSRYLTVEREGDPNKYPATVQFVAHDCDLALITVSAPDFFKNMLPLRFGEIPALESTVSAYGYPIGGERMAVTNGIVSRIDFQLYTHSSVDQHLAIQISAQINPGNSGGPVMQDGKVVGVAFQGYSGDVAQGVAYMIPTPVIKRFLQDIGNGHYDEYPDLAITYAKLQNPAQRRFLGLKDDDRGVLVSSVVAAGPSNGILYWVTFFSLSTAIRSPAMRMSNWMVNTHSSRKSLSENSRAIQSSWTSCATNSRRRFRSNCTSPGHTRCRDIATTCGRVTSFTAVCFFNR